MSEQAHNQTEEQHHQLWQDYDELPVGEILRRARDHYSLSLADIEAAIRIRASQLHAIELGRMDLLPGRVYAIGFVRSYAEYLGLDGHKIVYLFKEQTIGNKGRPELHIPAEASESKLPNRYVLGGSFAALVLFAVILAIFTGAKEQVAIPSVAEKAMELTQLDIDVTPLQAAIFAAIETAAGDEGPQILMNPPSRITINVLDSVWLEIRDDKGEALLSRILEKGDSYLVPDAEGLVMDTGNVGALQFIIDGQDIPRLGEIGDVKRDLSLDPDNLQSL